MQEKVRLIRRVLRSLAPVVFAFGVDQSTSDQPHHCFPNTYCFRPTDLNRLNSSTTRSLRFASRVLFPARVKIMTDQQSTGNSPQKSMPPQHLQILDELEAKARRCCNDAEHDDDGADNAEKWTLADDARLASYIQAFTAHVQRRAEEVAEAVVALESQTAKAALQVEVAKSQFLRLPEERFVEQVVVDRTKSATEPDADKKQEDMQNVEDDNDDHDVAGKQQELEEQAIKDGMKALSLFYDPADQGGDTDHYFGLDNVEDSAVYYESAPQDTFNQRPLPYVVGSREFLESTDVGLGDDYDEEEEDDEDNELSQNEGNKVILETSGGVGFKLGEGDES